MCGDQFGEFASRYLGEGEKCGLCLIIGTLYHPTTATSTKTLLKIDFASFHFFSEIILMDPAT